ncbi:MAG: 30S ribosomal protein S6 [Caldilineaceae bacterium]
MSEVTASAVNLHEYEVVYIAQPGLDDEGVNALNERFAQTVGNYGGQVVSTEPWGRRNLAYTIQKHGSGHYVLQRFQMPAAGTNEVERFLRLNENIIRYLVVRTDE